MFDKSLTGKLFYFYHFNKLFCGKRQWSKTVFEFFGQIVDAQDAELIIYGPCPNKKAPTRSGLFWQNRSAQRNLLGSPPATSASAVPIPAGDPMIFMKLFSPIMLRSGKQIAIRKRACRAKTWRPFTSISYGR